MFHIIISNKSLSSLHVDKSVSVTHTNATLEGEKLLSLWIFIGEPGTPSLLGFTTLQYPIIISISDRLSLTFWKKKKILNYYLISEILYWNLEKILFFYLKCKITKILIKTLKNLNWLFFFFLFFSSLVIQKIFTISEWNFYLSNPSKILHLTYILREMLIE